MYDINYGCIKYQNLNLCNYYFYSATNIFIVYQKSKKKKKSNASYMTFPIELRKGNVCKVYKSSRCDGKEKLFPFGQGGGEELSKRLNVDFIGSLPLYKNVSEYSESGNLAEFASDENFSVIENMVNAINNIAPKKKPINLKIN